jgi:hypothetical protein
MGYLSNQIPENFMYSDALYNILNLIENINSEWKEKVEGLHSEI